jgi:quercetin dioxygenase-like cupin family protein
VRSAPRADDHKTGSIFMSIIDIDDFRAGRDSKSDILRLVHHSETMTLVFMHAPAGATIVPVHDHVAEQFSVLLEGELAVNIGNETHRLTPGRVALIPSNTPHGLRAICDSVVVEVFSPRREDFA